ncbi:hypothetical protein [Tumebacillus permanentifrigoris]|uniref:Uncharacterized protein n=1 Tax=Tumebacillus permanentifrigoris TaxID=378543 RepID=A0A316D599_9BACL|nr:hypothetical protein [Tumebacillus permanentifrigoris]PWK08486.1 hypothetical protein C7459_115151 [Tumebacillus permanentifrigoris]
MGDHKAILLLPNDRIGDWWASMSHIKNPKKGEEGRQELLRRAIEIGLDVMEGRVVTVSPEQYNVLTAFEVLGKGGYLGLIHLDMIKTIKAKDEGGEP